MTFYLWANIGAAATCCHDSCGYFIHNFIHRVQHFYTDPLPHFHRSRLDAQQLHFTTQLQRQVFRQHGKRQCVRRSADAVDLIHSDPEDGPGRFSQVRRVDQENNIRRKAAQGCGAVLRGVTGFQDEDGVEVQEETGFRQAPSGQDPGRVIRAERVANSEDRDPRLSIPALYPLLQELAY